MSFSMYFSSVISNYIYCLLISLELANCGFSYHVMQSKVVNSTHITLWNHCQTRSRCLLPNIKNLHVISCFLQLPQCSTQWMTFISSMISWALMPPATACHTTDRRREMLFIYRLSCGACNWLPRGWCLVCFQTKSII